MFPSEAAGLLVAPPKPLLSYLKDHRKRLREGFDSAGLAAVPDYELLELVLFRALRRQDVKPLARRPLARFHGFNGVISTPIDQLLSVSGVGNAVVTELKIVKGLPTVCRRRVFWAGLFFPVGIGCYNIFKSPSSTAP